MPRYKFSWENLPPTLLRALKADLALEGEPAGALRRLYGARPSSEFVQANWPALLDRWLKSDRPARLAVIEELRARRLGDMSIVVGNAADQMSYLRSCRNSATLRDIVAASLTAAGKAAAAAKAPQTEVLTAGKRSKGWQQFVTSLAASLSAVHEDEYLIITLKNRPGFVQFAGQGAHGIRAELISNAYLDDAHQLSSAAIDSAIALGWNPPSGDPGEATADKDPDGSPNFYRDFAQPVAYIDIARLAVDTLVDVLGAAHPGMLQYKAFADDGAEIRLPTLGLKVESDPPADTATTVGDPSTHTEQGVAGADAIRATILTMLRNVSGDDTLQIDGDGDIPLRYDSAMVFVRVFGNPPTIRVFAPVLADARSGVDLTAAVNELNNQYLFMKWFVDGTTIVAAIDLFGDPLVEQHVLHACGVLGETANDLDEQLQQRFGGRTFFGEYAAPKLDAAQFGYL